MKKVKKISLVLLILFSVITIQPSIVSAKEYYNAELNLQVNEDEKNELSLKAKDKEILNELKDVFELLNTKDNINSFVVTQQELDLISKLISNYEENIDKSYVGNDYNKDIKLFENRQETVGYCYLLKEARNSNLETKDKLENITKEIVELNDLLLSKLINFIDENLLDKSKDINGNIFREITDMKDKAITIYINGNMAGATQTVDIQKYQYDKGLLILKNINVELPEDDDIEQPEDALKDTDNDGLVDNAEEIFGGDKNKSDTDGDGLTDEQEYHLYPYCKLDMSDTDEDGVSDLYEDLDGDGLTNEEEFNYNTQPLEKDSDLDGLSDSEEIRIYKTNPNKVDTDDDGLTDKEEVELGTDPNKADSDGDGLKDSKSEFEKTEENDEILVDVKGDSDAVQSLKVDKVEEFEDKRIPGQISSMYELKYNGKLESRTITFNIDTSNVDMNDLKVMYFDEEDQVLKLVEGQENRKTKSGLLTVYAPYGDRFVLVSYKAWLEKWTGYVPSVPKPNVDGNLKRDFLILMDDSLFMRSFDKKDERVESAKWFINRLFKDDRAAVAHYSKKLNKLSAQQLTNNKLLLNYAIQDMNEEDTYPNSIKDIWGDALNIIAPPGSKDNGREKYIIYFATTPQNDEYEIARNLAKAEGVRVIVFDCGKWTEHDYLERLARGTGGEYWDPQSAGVLIGCFSLALKYAGGGNEIDNSGIDIDGDGLSDELEKKGIRDGYGVLAITDPYNADTDGDGIEDGAEVRVKEHIPQEFDVDLSSEATGLEEYNGSKYFKFLSNPSKADTDGDGVDDLYEVELGVSSPFHADEDGDGLNDRAELNNYTNPIESDTDGDGVDDKTELYSLFSDPRIWEEKKTKAQYTDELMEGMIKGDAIENPTTTNIVGAIGGSIIPGIGTIADIRDTIINAFKGEWAMAGMNLAGIIPAYGDSAEIVAKITKYLDEFKYSDKILEFAPHLLKWGDDLLPLAAKADIIKRVLIASGTADIAIKFFGLDDVLTRRAATVDDAAEVLAKLGEKSGLDASKFIDGIKQLTKIDPDFLNKDFSGFGKFMKEVITDESGKYSEELAKSFCKDVSLHLKLLDTSSVTARQQKAFLDRLKGYMGEFVKKDELAKEGYESMLKSGKGIVSHGPDELGYKMLENGNSELKVIEAKCYKGNVSKGNIPKYFDKSGKYLNLNYIEEYINDPKVIEEVLNGKCNLEFELSLLQRDNPDVNSEISKNLKVFFDEKAGEITKQKAIYIPADGEDSKYMEINVKWTKNNL